MYTHLLSPLFYLLVDEIADLQARIVDLEQARDVENASYEQQLEQLRAEYNETKDRLVADNVMKGKSFDQICVINC